MPLDPNDPAQHRDRAAAALLDAVLLFDGSVLAGHLLAPLLPLWLRNYCGPPWIGLGPMLLLEAALIHRFGRSAGHAWMGLRVIALGRQRDPSFGQSLLRQALKLGCAPLALLVPERSARLLDRWSETAVVCTPGLLGPKPSARGAAPLARRCFGFLLWWLTLVQGEMLALLALMGHLPAEATVACLAAGMLVVLLTSIALGILATDSRLPGLCPARRHTAP